MLMILVGILIAAEHRQLGLTLLSRITTSLAPNLRPLPVSTTVTTVTSISASIPTGVLAAQITDPPDPPNAPAGTTHIYIDYSDIEAHTTTQNSNSVWFTVAKTGMIDLFSVLNVGLTLGSAEVPSGIFDQARFDITNATVTFGGINYTASVPLNQIMVPLSNGGALVTPNASAGFVIDVAPTVLALNNGGTPSFEIITATQGLSIPSQSWTGSLTVAGSMIQNITSQPWWKGPTPIGDNLAEPYGFTAQIYPTTLLVILNNTGSVPVTISGLNILTTGEQSSQNNATLSTSTIVSTITTVTTITIVTTITGNSSGKSASPAAPQATSTSSTSSQITVATFLILTNGSVIQPSPNGAPIPSNQVGLTIKPNQVVVLLYLGIINTLNSPNPPYAPQNIIGGQEYAIQIVTPFGSSIEFTVNASYPTNVSKRNSSTRLFYSNLFPERRK